MRKLILSILLFGAVIPAVAQGWDYNREDGGYIWGEGWGRSVDDADRDALASLSSKISLVVSGQYRLLEEQRDSNRGTESVSIRSNQLAMTSNATLSNTHREVRKEGRKYYVRRWMDRKELDTVWSDRKERVLEYESSALMAERDGRIDDALRYHWWAYVLLQSLQRPAELRDKEGRMLVNSIPERLNAVLDDIKPRADRQGNTLILSFSFRGRPVQGLDFTYFDGARWSAACSASRGSAQVELEPGALAEVVQLRIEYAYLGDSLTDPELSGLLASAEVKPLKKAFKIFRRI
jgi:hypothetical protein